MVVVEVVLVLVLYSCNCYPTVIPSSFVSNNICAVLKGVLLVLVFVGVLVVVVVRVFVVGCSQKRALGVSVDVGVYGGGCSRGGGGFCATWGYSCSYVLIVV